MAEFSLPLTDAEKEYLVSLLESALGDTRMEVHHTRTPAFRDRVVQEEALVRGLLERLRQTGS
jgi:hypothetical protein